MTTPSDCRELCLHLSTYLDGEAAADLCAALEAHLATCQACRLELDSLACTLRLVKALPAPELPPQAAARLYQSLGLPPPA
jgi:RNA polymerase sigma-70 factor (ECF subfamily)